MSNSKMSTGKSSAARNRTGIAAFLSPGQQWLALSLLALLGLVAVFYFGIGGISAGHSG